MNNFKVISCCVALSLMAAVGFAGDDAAYVPGKVLIKFEPGIMPMELTTGILEVDAVLQSFDIKSITRALTYRPLHSDAYDRWWLLDFPEYAPVGEIIEILQPISGVEHAGLSHILYPASEPTDPCFVDQLQWNLHNTGQRGGMEDADIDAPEGWAYFGAALPGSPAVIVAVIDSGIKKSHPEYNTPNRLIIINESEQNFTSDPSLEDICGNYHGTRVTGFVAANWNNTKQLAGIDAQCRIMPLKIFEGINCTGDSTWQRASDAIHYAADNGAKIISMSVQSFTGICDTGSLLYSAINYARDPANGGCIIIAAAGNCGAGHADTSMPGCFREVISVGATDNRDQRAIWQNRTDCISAKSGFNDSATGSALDVMAPAGCGKDDTGTVCGAAGTAGVWASSVHHDPNPGITACEGFSGTSSAAPQVAGVTSLMLALDPSLTHDEAACLLAAGADDLGAAGRDNDFGWGRISMGQTFNCMAISPTGAPGPVALVAPGPGSSDQPFDVSLVWEKNCSLAYDVYLGETNPPPLAEPNFGGTTYEPLGLMPGRTYYWKIKAYGWQMGVNDCVPSALSSESLVQSFTTMEGPYIVLDSFSQAAEVGGDGDGYMEAGEIWRLDVTLKNEGTMDATAVSATLDADVTATDTMEPLFIYNATADFGPIPVDGTATYSYIFRLDPAAWDGNPFECGKTLHIDLININAQAGVPPGTFYYPEIPAFFNPVVGIDELSLTRTAGNISAPPTSTSADLIFDLSAPGATFVASVTARLNILSNPTTCAKLELLWAGGSDSLVLKDFGTSPPTDGKYDVSAFYAKNKAGTYNVRLSRKVDPTNCTQTQGTTGGITMIVEQNFPEACAIYTPIGIYATSNQGTTAGGAWISLVWPAANPPNSGFETGLSVSMDPNCSDTPPTPVEAVEYFSPYHIRVKTPTAASESAYDVTIVNPSWPDYCQVNAYTYKTLAFTANQGTAGPGSQSVSIVDTFDNSIFVPKGSMTMNPAVVPMNLAYNRNSTEFTAPGRILYMVDYASGNIEVFDAANFQPMDMDAGTTGVQSTVTLQDPAASSAQPRAYDLAMSRDGRTMFISHVTSGIAWPDPVNPGPGGVSVLTVDEHGNPALYDVDQDPDPDTTSSGAPAGSGITRLRLKTGEGEYAFVYPLSIQSVSITDGVSPYTYRDGEPFPGEYIFVSAVSQALCVWNCTCAPGRICLPPIYEARPAIVVVIDNNPSLYCDLNIKPQHCLDPAAYYNPRYWKNRIDNNAYKAMGDGVDGINLGQTSQALGFSLTSGMPPLGAPPLGPTVYMLNENEGKAYLFNYDQAAGDWNVVMDPIIPIEPFKLATGPNPTDVKVQRVGAFRYAYITNAGDDTVRIINTTNNTRFADPDPMLKLETYPNALYPTSFDTRSVGDGGYSANYEDGTVSVFNLASSSFQGMIDVGEAPIRIVVQPVPGGETFFAQVRSELAFAQPTDFTTPPKQSNLIRDWEDVHQLQETSADPQAVLANINAFQTKVNNWVTNTTLRKIMNEGMNLYRLAYIHDHPTARQ